MNEFALRDFQKIQKQFILEFWATLIYGNILLQVMKNPTSLKFLDPLFQDTFLTLMVSVILAFAFAVFSFDNRLRKWRSQNWLL